MKPDANYWLVAGIFIMVGLTAVPILIMVAFDALVSFIGAIASLIKKGSA
jgi:hypothetical protein